jgi:hypothetical protein
MLAVAAAHEVAAVDDEASSAELPGSEVAVSCHAMSETSAAVTTQRTKRMTAARRFDGSGSWMTSIGPPASLRGARDPGDVHVQGIVRGPMGCVDWTLVQRAARGHATPERIREIRGGLPFAARRFIHPCQENFR